MAALCLLIRDYGTSPDRIEVPSQYTIPRYEAFKINHDLFIIIIIIIVVTIITFRLSEMFI